MSEQDKNKSNAKADEAKATDAKATDAKATDATTEGGASSAKEQAKSGVAAENAADEVAQSEAKGGAEARGAANEAASDGEDGRAERGQSAEGEISRPKTALEARQANALAARRATDSTVSPHSTTLIKPDAELLNELTTDALTARREQLEAEAADEGTGGRRPSAKRIAQAFDEVTEAQEEVDVAVRKRDAARDRYDRLAELLDAESDSRAATAGYLAAQAKARADRVAKAHAAE